MTVYYGKRGQAFENLIDYTNQVYKNKGIALINKRPTPMKIIGQTRGKQHLCVFDKKSTVDYDGIYRGKPIVFEAKSTGLKRVPLDIIADHQIEYLDQADNQGAISFLIVEIRPMQDVYIVSNAMLQKYVKDAQNGGRKSISIDDLEIYAELVEQGGGVPLNYLSVVDKFIEIAV